MASAKVFAHTSANEKTYWLNSKLITLKSGYKRTIYYFTGYKKDETGCALPAGWLVIESKNGLPYLKKAA